MKWVGRFIASAAAVLLSSGTGSASTAPLPTPADEAWATASKQDSLEAYAAFVMFYPDSPHAKAAYDRLSGVKVPLQAEEVLLKPEPESASSEPAVKADTGNSPSGFSSVAGKIWWIV